MRTDIIVVDNFYLDPGAVREYALKQLEHDFYYPYQRRADVESGRTRCTWVATRFKAPDDCPFKSSTELVVHSLFLKEGGVSAMLSYQQPLQIG